MLRLGAHSSLLTCPGGLQPLLSCPEVAPRRPLATGGCGTAVMLWHVVACCGTAVMLWHRCHQPPAVCVWVLWFCCHQPLAVRVGVVAPLLPATVHQLWHRCRQPTAGLVLAPLSSGPEVAPHAFFRRLHPILSSLPEPSCPVCMLSHASCMLF